MRRFARSITDALVEFAVFNLMAGAEVANWLHRVLGGTAIRLMQWQLSRRLARNRGPVSTVEMADGTNGK
jgi:hypothetical protein